MPDEEVFLSQHGSLPLVPETKNVLGLGPAFRSEHMETVHHSSIFIYKAFEYFYTFLEDLIQSCFQNTPYRHSLRTSCGKLTTDEVTDQEIWSLHPSGVKMPILNSDEFYTGVNRNMIMKLWEEHRPYVK